MESDGKLVKFIIVLVVITWLSGGLSRGYFSSSSYRYRNVFSAVRDGGTIGDVKYFLDREGENSDANTLLSTILLYFDGDTLKGKSDKKRVLSIFKYLVEKEGANVNYENKILTQAIKNVDKDDVLGITKFLVKHGANVDGGGQYVPLIEAVKLGYIDVVKYLVEKGADVNKCNNDGYRPLTVVLACPSPPEIYISQKTRQTIEKYLIAKGAKRPPCPIRYEYTAADSQRLSELQRAYANNPPAYRYLKGGGVYQVGPDVQGRIEREIRAIQSRARTVSCDCCP